MKLEPDILWSGVGSFVGIALVGALGMMVTGAQDLVFLIGSFGASAVLLHGVPASPLSQPRNLLGGHVVSALVGVTAFQLVGDIPWLAAAAAVALAMMAMQATRTVHPPGGATALIAVLGPASVHKLGYMYVLAPVAAGAGVMLAVAILVNAIAPGRRYPTSWW